MIPEIAVMALLAVESPKGERWHDGGDGRGRYAHHEIMVVDVNRIYGTFYRWPDDSENDETAKDISMLYILAYAKPGEPPHHWYQRYCGGPNGVRQNVRHKRAMEYEAEYKRLLKKRGVKWSNRN